MNRNGGTWTEARFTSFIRVVLLSISMRWPPKNKVKQNARVQRGVYLCSGYGRSPHEVPASLPPKPGNKRRINNSVVDHIQPVVDPRVGFVDWNTLIKRLFCEENGFQLLCHECHSDKTADERKLR